MTTPGPSTDHPDHQPRLNPAPAPASAPDPDRAEASHQDIDVDDLTVAAQDCAEGSWYRGEPAAWSLVWDALTGRTDVRAGAQVLDAAQVQETVGRTAAVVAAALSACHQVWSLEEHLRDPAPSTGADPTATTQDLRHLLAQVDDACAALARDDHAAAAASTADLLTALATKPATTTAATPATGSLHHQHGSRRAA